MKKILLIIGFIVSLNANASDVIMSWNCDGLIVSLCEGNVICVGELEYQVHYPTGNEDVIILTYDGRPMLEIRKTGVNTITIINTDNRKDRKTFIKCS
jgi:hypothetical protein